MNRKDQIIKRINSIEILAREFLREATLLRKEMSESGVSGISPKGLSENQINKLKLNRKKRRLKK